MTVNKLDLNLQNRFLDLEKKDVELENKHTELNNKIDENHSEILNKFDEQSVSIGVKFFEQDAAIAAKVSGSPKGVFATLNDLISSTDTDASGIYITQDTGKWYWKNESVWEEGGVYQANGILDGCITIAKLGEFLKKNIQAPQFMKVHLKTGTYTSNVYQTCNYRVCSSTPIIANECYTLVAKNGYKFGIQTIDDTGNFKIDTGWKKFFYIEKGVKYNIVIAKQTEDSVQVLNCEEFASNVCQEYFKIKNYNDSEKIIKGYDLTENFDVDFFNGYRNYVSGDLSNSSTRITSNLLLFNENKDVVIEWNNTNDSFSDIFCNIIGTNGTSKTLSLGSNNFYFEKDISYFFIIGHNDNTDIVLEDIEYVSKNIKINTNNTIKVSKSFIPDNTVFLSFDKSILHSGSISSGVIFSPSKTRLYSDFIIGDDSIINIFVPNGFKIGLVTYKLNDELSLKYNWTGWLSGNIKIIFKNGYKYRYQIGREGDEEITVSDFYAFKVEENVLLNGIVNTVNDICMPHPNFISWGHQGYNITYSNQTETAFKEALKRGANGLECDINFTSDNKIVLNHDDTFTTIDNKIVTIGDETFNEVRSYPFGNKAIDIGKIMSLEEILVLIKKWGVLLCIDKCYKADTPKKLDTILDLVEKYGLWDQVLFCATLDQIPLIKERYFDANLGFTTDCIETEEGRQMVASYKTEKNFVSISYYRGDNGGNIDVGKVIEARKLGIKVYGWNIDDYDEFKQMFYILDGIFSNKYYAKDIE